MYFDILNPDWGFVEMFVSSSSMNYVCVTKEEIKYIQNQQLFIPGMTTFYLIHS